MNNPWLLPVLIAFGVGLAVGGALAGLLGRRIDPTNPPAKPSALARTAKWLGILSAVGLVLGLVSWPEIFMSLLTAADGWDSPAAPYMVYAMIPALIAYAAATATIVMSLTALARRDRSSATWTGLVVAGLAFVPATAFAVAIIFFGFWGGGTIP